MKKIELINLINSMELDKDCFVVLSSSALVLRGILESANDLDIAVTNKGLEHLKDKYNLTNKDNDWYKVTDDIECVLDNMEGKKELLGNYYVQDINDYLEYLKSSNREKDKLRISMVEEYIRTR